MIGGGRLLPAFWDSVTVEWAGVSGGGGGGGVRGVVCSQWSAHCSTL